MTGYNIMVDEINFVSSTKQLLAEIKIVIKTAEYCDNLRFIYSECISIYINFHIMKKADFIYRHKPPLFSLLKDIWQ